MQKSKKILVIINIIIILIFLFQFKTLGMDTNYYEPNNLEPNKNYLTVAGNMLNIVSTLGIAVAIIVLTIVGLKFMFGSIEEKAKYKETLFSYLMGCGMLMFTSVIMRVIANFCSK